jgi:hypothetical protein
MENLNINESPTYLKVGDETSSLEFDLVTFRQKGKEERYLSVSFLGYNINKEPVEAQEAFINVGEEDFNKIKSFFSNLEWKK